VSRTLVYAVKLYSQDGAYPKVISVFIQVLVSNKCVISHTYLINRADNKCYIIISL